MHESSNSIHDMRIQLIWIGAYAHQSESNIFFALPGADVALDVNDMVQSVRMLWVIEIQNNKSHTLLRAISACHIYRALLVSSAEPQVDPTHPLKGRQNLYRIP